MVFLNLLNKIFGPKKMLTRQEIDDYKNDIGDTYQTELKASNSPFEMDALDGWSEHSFSVEEQMSSLDKKMETLVNQSTSNKGTDKGTVISLILYSVAMLTLIIFTYKGNQIYNEQTNYELEITEVTSPILEIDELEQISEEKLITKKDLIESNQDKGTGKFTQEVIALSEESIETEEINELETENFELPIQTENKIPNSNKGTLSYYQAKEVYLSDLKNVDYRSYRNRPIRTTEIEVGIPADMENENSSRFEQNTSTQKVDISYFEYLSETAMYFSQEDYKTALKRYLIILDNYPNDVNANFYGGLCYFNLGQYELAIKHFEDSYSIGYGNFREEAMWFSARANYESENYIGARHLLKRIIKEEGFYNENAKELLIEIP